MYQAFSRFSGRFKGHVCGQENGAGDGLGTRLSEPHIDEFAVEFVYIYYYYLYVVRRAVSHLQLLFCVHHLIFVASHVHAI